MDAHVRRAFLLVGFAGALASLRAFAAPTETDYVGRWNLRILGVTDTFESSWLKVDSQDGRLRGSLVWKWGGVTEVRDVAVEEGELRFVRGRESYRAKLDGGELRGTMRDRGGASLEFVGRRAQEMCDVGGTWRVYAVDDAERREAKLILEETDGKIGGSAVDPEGNSYEVRDAKLDGYILTFTAVTRVDADHRPQVCCEMRGDELVGVVEVNPRDGGEKRPMEIRGTRERKWGAPVTLLSKDSLEGWKPRDPKRKFGWKISGGVLENSPPDVDIMSESKFRDFKLHLEYKVKEDSNSGIYLRGRYELQIYGGKDEQPYGNMAVYSRLSPGKNPIKEPLEENWQAVDVTFVGRWVTVVLNGEVVHDNAYLEGITGGAIDPWEEEPGPLLLQGDHGPVAFRNIVVTPAE